MIKSKNTVNNLFFSPKKMQINGESPQEGEEASKGSRPRNSNVKPIVIISNTC